MKVVMVYFIGFQSKDKRSLVIDQQSSMNIKWVIDIMCEHICGPKVLIVDDPSSKPLDVATPLPPDVLMCVPLEREPIHRSPGERDSFTLNLAQKLAAHPEQKLLNIIKTTAFNWKYQKVDSNLFYA
ncbi:uncharacterized protein LOC110241826 [Exaiptasia diaphana]|uniref:Uncharacterized protein n=1 Tax=Exaiptasia diaphana TaxID=2652724 RepID=A0A913XEZ7_EXADI|nr:uncharacterized protein LOC110241826 [Exaiptasia diaphana]